ncbi:platelet glycoprotein VI [Manis javanica]|uniref:platelet glycoprotein VI n=1 Tax=Manis javanica TaxID=9974 RepID=UPI003C6CD62A
MSLKKNYANKENEGKCPSALPSRRKWGVRTPSLAFPLSSGLCLGHVTQDRSGLLPKPSLRALPSSLVPLGKPVTLRCQGPPGVDLYRLEQVGTKYHDLAVLFIPAMRETDAGCYRCSYQNGSSWSPASDQLELVTTGAYDKPSLSAWPSPAVSLGEDVTLHCQSHYGFDQFALHKEGDTAPYKGPERWYRADFPILTVMAAHSGTYRCYGFFSSRPYLWSPPSDPLELVVTEISVTPRRLPPEPPSAVTEPSRNTTVLPKGTASPAGLAHQYYTKGNVVRLCLGAVVLLLLVGLLVEDRHSRQKRRPLRVRAVHRPLPPLP